MGRSIGVWVVLAGACGGALASASLALMARDLCLFVIVVPVATIFAVPPAAVFAVAVSLKYGNMPQGQHAGHRAFWCVLSFILGVACAAVPIIWLFWLIDLSASC